jgi:hypothetical protein
MAINKTTNYNLNKPTNDEFFNVSHQNDNMDLIDSALNNKVDKTTYTALDVLDKVKTVDGTGSGLDADKLDGLEATEFATAAQGTKADNALPASSYTASDVLTKIKTVDGTGSGLDADTVDGIQGADLIKKDGSVPMNNLTIGTRTGTVGTNSFAQGINCEASGSRSHAEGDNTTASGNYSHAEGSNTTASGGQSHAEGAYTTASGNYSHAEGSGTKASGNYSHAEGYGSIASGDRSHAQNSDTKAQGYAQTAIGRYNIAQGNPTTYTATDDAFIIGNGTSDVARSNAFKVTFDGKAWTQEGYYVGASNDKVWHAGNDGTGSGLDADTVDGIEGADLVKKDGSVPMNNLTIGTRKTGSNVGTNSFAQGNSCTASNTNSHAEGSSTIASGGNSHAEGYNTTASGGNSHAEGGSTTASGNYSHAEGSGTTASGSNSHAEGSGTKASGNDSHAQNRNTTAQGFAQTAIGRFNIAQGTGTSIIATDDAFIIGNGTGPSARSNAFKVTFDGKAWTQEGFYVGASNDKVLHEGNISSSALNLANASGIKGTGTGPTNVSYFNFFESNGTTRQGYIGYGDAVGTLFIWNELSSDVYIKTHGAGKAKVNGNEIYHAGNLKALTSTTNSFYGDNAGRLNTGSNNTGIGEQALYSASLTGNGNTAVGKGTLNSNSSASYNTGIGMRALDSTTSGSNNVAVGTYALQMNTTGAYNVGIGYGAGRYYGTATYSNTTANRCIYIGYDTKSNADNANNEIVIGYAARGKGSNTAHIGNTSITQISFGAGTGTAFTNVSDRRLKEDIQDADTSICYDTIKNLPLHRFKYKDFVGNEGDIHLTGFIADEFERYFPKAVYKHDTSFPVLDEDGQPVKKTIIDDEGNEITREIEETFVIEDCASIDTSQLTPTIVGALKALMDKVEILEAEIVVLKGV